MSKKGLPPLHHIEAEIERIWKDEIKKDFLDRKILYYEHTLQAAFYHHLRPYIDKYPRLRMFLEYEDPIIKKKKYDLTIQIIHQQEKWEDYELWHKDFSDLWIVIEFKFHPSLKDKGAQVDIRKLYNAQKKHSSIQRVYFFSIDRNIVYTRFLSRYGEWYKKCYREGRGVPSEDNKDWEFRIRKFD